MNEADQIEGDFEVVTVKQACRMLGGDRPLHPSTYYRGVAKGIYPAPFKMGPGISRIRTDELIEAKRRLAEAARAAA